jgi:hypothetical protein
MMAEEMLGREGWVKPGEPTNLFQFA